MTNLCFFHAGPDTGIASMLCRSAKLAYGTQEHRIIHICDGNTNPIEGANQTFEAKEIPTDTIMYARLWAYEQAAKAFQEPLIFLDTDMLITRPIQSSASSTSSVLCRRSFNNDAQGAIQAQTPDGLIDFGFDPSQTLGEIFPYLGCYLETASHEFLGIARAFLSDQSRELQQWYGDQLAIKKVAQNKAYIIKEVTEQTHACLPEKLGLSAIDEVRILHFKGQRKQQMPHFLEHFEQFGIQPVLQSFALKI